MRCSKPLEPTYHIPPPRRLRHGREELLLQYIERLAGGKLSELDSETLLILAYEVAQDDPNNNIECGVQE